jgi:hypothetical protein
MGSRNIRDFTSDLIALRCSKGRDQEKETSLGAEIGFLDFRILQQFPGGPFDH